MPTCLKRNRILSSFQWKQRLFISHYHSSIVVPTIEHPAISNAKINKEGDHMQGYIHLSNSEHIYFQSSGLRGLYEDNIKKDTSVVLLHGKKYHSQTWHQNRTLQYLLRNKYGNIAFDQPGYGNSSGKRHDAEDATIEWLIECLDKLELTQNIVLIMPSMSGLYGLQWIFDDVYSKYLSGLITLAPAFCDEYDVNQFKGTHIPTCVIYGEHDETGLHRISNEKLLQIPNRREHQIDGAPHACYLKSNAKEFHKLMIGFLDEVIEPEPIDSNDDIIENNS